jgi:DNA mismatch repair protein MutS2
MKSLVNILEIPLILTRIQSDTKTVLGQKWMMDENFIPETLLPTKLTEVDEMMQLMVRFSALPIGQSHHLEPILALIEKGSVISLEGLLAIHLDLLTVEKVLQFTSSIKQDFPALAKQWKAFILLKQLKLAIEKILTPQGTIRDDASADLYRIRKRLQGIDGQMLALIQSFVHRYGSHLTEPLYTIKNGRYVLPVATSSKGSVPGMIHDVSSTGLTTFIEPKGLVDLSLEKQLLQGEEQEAIFTILKTMTDVVAIELQPLRDNNLRLAYLDVVQAKANFGIQQEGYIGIMSSTPKIELIGARHPLIEAKQVIANDFILNEKQSIIIISGPNAGGKTVAMKTVGLFVYLHQLAIPLPTKQPAVLSYFKHIYADIGDQQSVLENLSTFAGHIQQLVPLTDQVKPNDLVLIDELGTGTDPKEGESLARSLLIHLQAKRAFVIVSSHFPGLKTLALQEPRMINASLQFDEEKLAPTYRFILGVPGKSYGLIMAKRYGLAPQVVAHAEKYLQDQQSSQDQQSFLKLQDALLEVEKTKADLAIEKQSTLQQQHAVKQQANILEKRLAQFKTETEEKQQQLLEDTLEKVESTIKALANPTLKLHEAIALKQGLVQAMDQPSTVSEQTQQTLQVDDYVIENSTGMKGRISAIQKNQLTMVTADGFTIKVKSNQVSMIAAPVNHGQQKPLRLVQSQKAPSSLTIIGLRFEEAKLAVEKYYDQALLSNLKTLKIIHGFGSGVLRKMVFDYFKSIATVKSIQQGDGEQAGYGVTTIHLK